MRSEIENRTEVFIIIMINTNTFLTKQNKTQTAEDVQIELFIIGLLCRCFKDNYSNLLRYILLYCLFILCYFVIESQDQV